MQILSKGKKLSYLLRHQPDLADKAGWVDVSIICRELQITKEFLQEIVDTNNKQRFEFSENKEKIKARQGHSIPIDLDLKSVKPPETLFHGTTLEHKDSILEKGLLKQKRHAVHLTQSFNLASDRAITVSLSIKDTMIVVVDALKMHKEGYKFHETTNKVWLTDYVPPQYLKCISK